jgi:uncharacterized protein YkwD
MDYGWINCPNCNEQYVDYAAECPNCSVDNPLKPTVAKSRSKTGKNSSSLMIAALGILAGVGILAFLVVGNVGPFDNLLSTNVKNSSPITSDRLDESETGSIDEQPSSASDQATESPGIEYVQVTKEKRLVQDRTMFSPHGVKTYKLVIPQVDDASLRGAVILRSGYSVNVSILDESQSNFCNPSTLCTFAVYGPTVSPSANKNDEFYIPLQDVSIVYVKLENPNDSGDQLTDIRIDLIYTASEENPSRSSGVVSISRSMKENIITQDGGLAANSIDNSQSFSDFSSHESDLAKYKEYALKLINEDRQQAGLSPVALSQNEAAQKHAEDILATGYLSHWTSDGMKPYMRYTMYKGLGNVGQNVAYAGYDKSDIPGCQSGIYHCPALDVQDRLKKSEYDMMYDDAHANWGHRDNILDPYHTHVSIGIAYDRYTFAVVQNFEDNLFTEEEITQSGYDVRIYGKFVDSQKYEAKMINVFYDPLPTSSVYEQEKSRASYDQGQFLGFITPPLSPGYYYAGDDFIVGATTWQANSYWVDLSFNLMQFYQKEGAGVYTVYLIVGTPGDDDSLIQTTSFSVFLQ